MVTLNKQSRFILIIIKTACSSLLQHKLRTTLSALGIVCGVMAVVAIIAIGEGAKQETLRQIERMGVTNIYIRSDQLTADQRARARQLHSDGLQNSDRYRLQSNNHFISATAASREQAINLTGFPEHLSPKLIECSASYGWILGFSMESGRFISEIDTSKRNQVCVLGWQIARGLGELGQVGQSLRIGGQLFQVIGILSRQDLLNTSETKLTMQNLNDTVFFPLNAIESRPKISTSPSTEQMPLTEIIVKVHSSDQVSSAALLIRRSLEIAHNGVDDFQLIIPLELLAQSQKIQHIFNIVLGIIGTISLVISGIGIMNIMLANISERINEIGLRRAVGARPEHIIVQFLSEAVLLTFTGGLCGIIGGIGLSLIIGALTDWPIRFSVPVLIVPLGVSIIIGLFFGLYPARKASLIDPIVALGSST